jgi:NADH:ubiquinone oxidoreductase subunit K
MNGNAEVVVEVADSIRGGYVQAFVDAGRSPTGFIMLEREGETCRDCCVRQRWKWSVPLLVLSLATVLIGALFSARKDNENWLIPFLVFLVGIVSAVVAVAVPVLLTWFRNRGGLRYATEQQQQRQEDRDVLTVSQEEEEHDFEAEL